MTNILNRFDDFVRNNFSNQKKEFSAYLRTIVDTRDVNSFNYQFNDGFQFIQYRDLEEAYNDAITVNRGNSSETLQRFPTYEDFNNFIYQETTTSRTSFQIMESLLTSVQEMVNLGGLLEKDKIKITADKNGIFDFSLASQGLFRPVEYYSEEFLDYLKVNKMSNPFILSGLAEGVVPTDKVFKNKQNNEFEFQYLGNDFICQQRQKGATEVLVTYPKECVLKETNKIFTTFDIKNTQKIFNGKDKAKLKYASSNKKSYLVYSKKPESSKYVDFYLPQNFVTSNTGYTLTSMFPLILTSAALEKFGIQSRISTMRIGADDTLRGNFTTAAVVPMKNYDESVVDAFPKLLALNADFQMTNDLFGDLKLLNEDRFYQKNFTSKFKTGNLRKKRFESFGRGFNTIGYENPSYFYNVLERYKNFLDENPELDMTKTISRNFFISDAYPFVTIRSINNTINQIKRDTVFIDNLDFIIYKFFFYMDYVAIELNSIKDMIDELQYRFESNKYFKSIFKVSNVDETIKEYLIEIIRQKYIVVSDFDSNGNPISFADTKTTIERKDKTYQEKADEIFNLLG